MPDWEQFVRTHLDLSDSSASRRNAIIQELSTHLEETYERARANSMTEAAAFEFTLQEVEDWYVLSKEIRRTKSQEGPMNHRTKCLWLPALASVATASLAMMLVQFAGARPHIVQTGGIEISLYWPWLTILPFCGALAAYLSRRDNGSTQSRLLAALAPVLWIFALSVLVEPVEIALSGMAHLKYFGYGSAQWILIPGLALLSGAAPFLREHHAADLRHLGA